MSLSSKYFTTKGNTFIEENRSWRFLDLYKIQSSMPFFRHFPSELYGWARDLYYRRQFQYQSQFPISMMGSMRIQSL